MTTQQSWWLQTLAEQLSGLDATAAGLGTTEARNRLQRFGVNLLHPPTRRHLAVQFLSRFRNPLIIVLLVASAISAASGEVASFLIIVAILLTSITLDFVQEYRAERAADKLRHAVSIRSKVLRDGIIKEVSADSIVPGDVVLLFAGDLVPADGRVLEARDLFVMQAQLTGEAYPVEKLPGDLAPEAGDLQDARNALFMGTSVISGTARMLVCKTGGDTALGQISGAVAAAPPPSAFEMGTRRFGLLIMRMTFLLVLFVLMVNVWFHRPLLESFLFAVALAVGLTPELLPMVVSVTLARGALRMAHRQVMVKRMSSIQNLGSMDVLCTDKTGTLTEAHIRLERHIDALGRNCQRTLDLAYINSYFETGLRSPLDAAILEHENIDVSAWRKIDEVQFDFERRRISVLVDDSTSRMLVVKGAPEDILRLSTHYEEDGPLKQRPLDDIALQQIQARCDALGKEGFRVLGIAWKKVPSDHQHAVVDDETALVFAGFAAFLDPPKDSAAKAIATLARDGVAVKIVTGDNELVTQYICARLGVAVTGILTGNEIGHMDDLALQARTGEVNLFCRMSPAQKSRVILALKARGHVVGYLGDGINDAPSLRAADVGLSVDSAVDVAKEAADMILLRRDLGVLHSGVIEGRRTFGNIMKYIMMGTSSNFGNMFSMAGASLFLPFLPMLPAQILLNNMLYDVSEVPIPMDHVDHEDLLKPHAWDMRFIRDFMLVVGPVSSLFDFLTFYVLIAVFHADQALFQTGWFIESLATQVLVIFVIRTRGNPLKSRAHPLLTATSLAVVCIAVLLPFTPVGSGFGFVAPPLKFLIILPAMTIAYLLMVEFVKRRFYSRLSSR